MILTEVKLQLLSIQDELWPQLPVIISAQQSQQLSQGLRDHKIIWGNQHCIATFLSYRKFHEGYSISVISCSLVSFWNPVLACFSPGLHTLVSQQWIFYLKTIFFQFSMVCAAQNCNMIFQKSLHVHISLWDYDDSEKLWKPIPSQLQHKCI